MISHRRFAVGGILRSEVSIAREGVGRLTVTETDAEPKIAGPDNLRTNQTLVGCLVKYGLSDTAADGTDNEKAREFFTGQAVAAEKTADLIMELLAAQPGPVQDDRWCSACFAKTSHERRERRWGLAMAYLCQSCGSPTTPCVVPACDAFAVLTPTGPGIRHYCAAHRHEIPSFAKLQEKLGDITQYKEWLEFEAFDALRLEKFLAVLPAMAIGSLVGGAMAAHAVNAYTRADKSFAIEPIRDGQGAPILLANGYLSQNMAGWGPWQRLVDERYPHNPVLRVHWGAGELRDVSLMFGSPGAAPAAEFAAEAAALAAKTGRGIGAVIGAATNSWWVAKHRADMTGALLADLIARTATDRFILVGHSLGARVMATAATILATRPGERRLETVHLTGNASTQGPEWTNVGAGVSGDVWNYYSANDGVLTILYKTAELGARAVGAYGFDIGVDKVHDVDVSDPVQQHHDYYDTISLR